MAIVKGSKQYRSVVVRYRPWQRSAVIILAFGLILAVAFSSTWLARSDFLELEQRLVDENHELKNNLLLATKEKDDASQQLANLKMAATVDRVSVDDVQQELKSYQDKIAGLTEEISFYKGLMSPSERDRGLSVRDLNIYKTASPHQFQYKLVLQQTSLKHRLLKGSVRVVIVGEAKNPEGVSVLRRYALADLSEDINVIDIPLRFKYFQNIEGELRLPNGFNVQKIELVARAISPKKVQIEKTYDWNVQG